MTRRQALSLLALATLPGRAQQTRGMASRGLKPVPFGKPSGLPWDAHFVNVAQPAGLRSRSRNTPFAGQPMKGRATLTIVAGRIVYSGENLA